MAGFGHRKLMKWCRKAGWDSLLRLKADSTVILPDGSRRRLDAWRPQPQALLHLADVLLLGEGGQRIGPLHVHIALAPQPADEPWYLASDGPYGCAALANYRCRYNIEHSIKDDKSGWNWEASPLRLRLFLDPRPDPDLVTAYGIPFLTFGRFTWIPASRPAGC
jgi:hypothetical protein